MLYQFKTIDERPENDEFEDEAAIQRFRALKATFLVRLAIQKYLANKDKAPMHLPRREILVKMDDHSFFRAVLFGKRPS